MSIYHLTAKTGSRNGGQSAKAKADYIQREGRYSRDRDEVLHTQSGHLPKWAERPADYWDVADLYERANGRLFKEVEFALPVELTLDQQRELVDEFARHLTDGERLPYTLAIHAGDGENPHCHLMISERKNDGIERPADQWFKRYNAKQPERGGAQKSESLKPKAWLEQTREAWSHHANRALERAGHEARIDHRTLEAQGIERLPGIHLGPNVVEMEGRGIRTERADTALSIDTANGQIIDLQEYREAIEHERDRQSEEIQRDQRVSGRDRAVGPEHGDTGGRSPAADRRGTAGQRGAGRELDEPATASHERMAGGSQEHEDSRRGADHGQPDGPERRPWLDVAAMGRSLDRFRDAYSCAADRIMALAGAARNRATGGHMADFQAQVKSDRTAQAIARQLKAMGCDRYDIGIRDAASGKMMNREWTPQEVQQNADWLKRMNAQGNDIYIRPAEQARHGLVLVDDLSSDDLDAMKQEGREPAAIIETSPKNYQAWVKVAQDAPAVHRGVIARELAREYDADPASADSRHYGRLAGFTNRKDKHTSRTGYQPWVLCRESSGQIATAGPELMQQAGQVLDSIERRQEKARRLEGIEAGPKPSYRRDAVDDYRSEMAGLIKRYGDDLSRCDFIAAMKLASNGREPDEIAKAMAEASPAIMDRKAGHEADYIQRTLQKVMELPQVQEARAELAKQAEKEQYQGTSLG